MEEEKIRVTFPCSINGGKGDTVNFEVEAEITKEEYDILIESAKTHSWFSEDDSEKAAELYDRIYDLSLKADIEYYLSDEDELREQMADYLDCDVEDIEDRVFTEEEIREMLEENPRSVYYPEEIEELAEEE